MKAFLFVTGAVAAGLLATACGPSSAGATAPKAGVAEAPVILDCGAGRSVAVRAGLVRGEQVWRAECVDAAPSARPRTASSTPGPASHTVPAATRIETASRPASAQVVERPVVHERVVYRNSSEPRRERRSWKKSAAIIGGGTAVGAGVGAVIDGGKGAKKGAVLGGIAGVVYDIVTRDKDTQ